MASGTNTLGAGSGLPPGTVPGLIDGTIGSVAIRTSSFAPSDADWGAVPPPNGTLCLEHITGDGGGILHVRVDGVWVAFASGPAL